MENIWRHAKKEKKKKILRYIVKNKTYILYIMEFILIMSSYLIFLWAFNYEDDYNNLLVR